MFFSGESSANVKLEKARTDITTTVANNVFIMVTSALFLSAKFFVSVTKGDVFDLAAFTASKKRLDDSITSLRYLIIMV